MFHDRIEFYRFMSGVACYLYLKRRIKRKRPLMERPFCMRLLVVFHSLLESGIITQQQLRTSPVDRIMSLALLFRKFQKWEMRFPIPTRSVGSGF